MTPRRAFSILELLAAIAIIAVLVAIALPFLTRARQSSDSAACLSNLRQLAAAFEMYTQSNGGYFPDDLAGVAWDDLLVPHLTADNVFRCPADQRYAVMGNSYQWRDSFAVFDPEAGLSRRNKSVLRDMTLLLLFESLPQRHDPGRINAATLDGSAASYTTEDFEANMALKAQ